MTCPTIIVSGSIVKLHALPFISPLQTTPLAQQQGSARANGTAASQSAAAAAAANPPAAIQQIGSGNSALPSAIAASQPASPGSKSNAQATAATLAASSQVDLSKPYRPGTFVNFTA